MMNQQHNDDDWLFVITSQLQKEGIQKNKEKTTD